MLDLQALEQSSIIDSRSVSLSAAVNGRELYKV